MKAQRANNRCFKFHSREDPRNLFLSLPILVVPKWDPIRQGDSPTIYMA